MVDKRFGVPLSPPYSPRMSEFAETTGNHSQHASKVQAHSECHPSRELSNVSLGSHDVVSAHSHQASESSLRYKSFAYSSEAPEGLYQQYNPAAFSQDVPIYGRQPKLSHGPTSSGVHQSSTYGAPRAASLEGQLTPRSPAISVQDQQDHDELIDSAGEDEDEGAGKNQMSAAELRAHKRKMKRFRLTHSQTRFLMSEFARQAHPDAGHRERLAREIPGLSARQVQVWFQNRRAKLKRHTIDDQARMMRSRAMPEDFDTTQALHSPFGNQQPLPGSSFSSMGPYSVYGEHGGPQPLILDTARGVAEYDQYSQQYADSTGASPALGSFAFTPPSTGSDHISPAPSNNMSPYGMQHHSTYDTARHGPSGLATFEHGYLQHPQRLSIREHVNRTYGEATISPLRASVSHSATGPMSGQPNSLPERVASFSDHTSYDHQPSQPPRSVGVTESSAYGAVYPYEASHGYSSNEAPQHQPTAANHEIGSERFRTAPSAMVYSRYPPTNITSAPYHHYSPSHASQEILSNYAQQVQAESSSQVLRDPIQPHRTPNTSYPLGHTTTSHPMEGIGGVRAMPPSY